MCRAQYLEMSLFMSCYLLNSQGDRMMMGNSVEGRVPFLDHRLIELAARIPPKFKLRVLEEKFILKRAFADILPDAIASRPKQPYRAPISSSFSAGDDTLVQRLLGREALQRSGFANAPAVEKLLAKPRCSCYSTCLSTTSNRPVPRFRMKNEHQLRSEIRQFVLDDLLMGDTASMLDDGESFLETGTIDSIGVLDIVMFLEHNFQLKVQDRELVPENLDSVNRLVQFVMRKTHAA